MSGARPVTTHDGTVLPSLKAAVAYYGVAPRTVLRYAVTQPDGARRITTDPRGDAHGIRVVLPDGTTRRSLSALARECGCLPQALYRYATQRTADTIWLSALPTKGRTQ
jgi:hypothetical protein